jgi:transposase
VRLYVKKQTSVDEFMQNLDHPFKEEVQILRNLILKVNKDINEEIKWNAPSFSYEGSYLVTFNLWEKERVHLVFHNPEILKVRSTLLEGNYDRRRMAYFKDKEDVRQKRFALEKVLKDLIKLQRKKRMLDEQASLE